MEDKIKNLIFKFFDEFDKLNENLFEFFDDEGEIITFENLIYKNKTEIKNYVKKIFKK
jgi:hypothetical protein